MKADEPAVAYGTNSYASDSNIAKAFDRLDYLATLGKDWDGEGALPISRQVINNLKRVLLISDDAD